MKIGVFAPGAAGDLLVSTALLPYKDKLWPGADIIWFAQTQYVDLLSGNPHLAEIREWTGFDNRVLRTEHNCLNQERKGQYAPVSDLDDGYFTTPWLVGAAHWGVPYSRVPKVICGVPDEWPWHPVVEWTPEEESGAEQFARSLGPGRLVMLETVMKSNQGSWNDSTTSLVMRLCRQKGDCTFIFASKGDHSRFRGFGRIAECNNFTLRQLVPIYNRCHAFFGCASGVSVVTCCHKASPKVVRGIYVGCENYGCIGIATGLNLEAYKAEHVEALAEDVLCRIK